ncbi:MAG: hypothetical protein RLZZ546_1936 [Bacteroidota bacterium]|jgi:PPP family 3-phenylpropionic acid transporter
MKMSVTIKIRILYFLVFACQAAWLPRLADYVMSVGINGSKMALLLSINPIMMLVVQPFYGRLSDRLGYGKTLFYSSGLAAASFGIYYWVNDFYGILLATLLMSIFFNALMPVLDAMALNESEKTADGSYGKLRIAGALGWSITGLILGYVIQFYGLKAIFIFSCLSMLLVFIFSRSIISYKLYNRDEEKLQVKQTISNKKFILFLFSIMIISMAMTAIWNFYSIYLTEIGASPSQVGFGLAFQGLCELPLFYFSGVIIMRYGLKTTFIFTLVTTLIRMLLYSYVGQPMLALCIELLHGVSWSLFWVVCVGLTDKYIDKAYQATGQSLLYASYFGIGAIVGNYWVSYLIEITNLSGVFLWNAGIIAVVIVFVYLIIDRDKSV